MRNRPPRFLSPRRLLACILINQLATPGLGSILARRTVAGSGQLCLALLGFGMIVTWTIHLFYRLILRQMGYPEPRALPDGMWRWGWILFGASWLWALVTSCSLWLEARRQPPVRRASVPPKLG